MTDRYVAEERTAVVYRGGVRTIKKMFETGNRQADEAACSKWVRDQNRLPPVEKPKKAVKKK